MSCLYHSKPQTHILELLLVPYMLPIGALFYQNNTHMVKWLVVADQDAFIELLSRLLTYAPHNLPNGWVHFSKETFTSHTEWNTSVNIYLTSKPISFVHEIEYVYTYLNWVISE